MDNIIANLYNLLHEKGRGYINDPKYGRGYKTNLWMYAKRKKEMINRFYNYDLKPIV